MNCKFSRTCGHEVCDIEFCPDFTEPTDTDKLEYLQAAAKGLGMCVVPLEPTTKMEIDGAHMLMSQVGILKSAMPFVQVCRITRWVFSAMTAAQEDKDE